jgi:hypothetical protein
MVLDFGLEAVIKPSARSGAEAHAPFNRGAVIVP